MNLLDPHLDYIKTDGSALGRLNDQLLPRNRHNPEVPVHFIVN